jgi:RNA polymerase sigma-70 factor (ECF subfamily)
LPSDAFVIAEHFDQRAEVAFVQAVLAGQEQAVVKFEERMRCVPRILGALNARRGHPLGEHELADLVQDTIVVVLRKLDEFAAHAPLEGWMYRLCFLEFLNAVRRRGRALRRTSELVEEPEAAGVDDLGEHVYDDVYRALELLGGHEADTIRLKHFDGLTFREIGDRVGVPANTAKTRYYRGLARLGELLRTYRRREEHE